jgi:hypothetical protein
LSPRPIGENRFSTATVRPLPPARMLQQQLASSGDAGRGPQTPASFAGGQSRERRPRPQNLPSHGHDSNVHLASLIAEPRPGRRRGLAAALRRARRALISHASTAQRRGDGDQHESRGMSLMAEGRSNRRPSVITFSTPTRVMPHGTTYCESGVDFSDIRPVLGLCGGDYDAATNGGDYPETGTRPKPTGLAGGRVMPPHSVRRAAF